MCTHSSTLSLSLSHSSSHHSPYYSLTSLLTQLTHENSSLLLPLSLFRFLSRVVFFFFAFFRCLFVNQRVFASSFPLLSLSLLFSQEEQHALTQTRQLPAPVAVTGAANSNAGDQVTQVRLGPTPSNDCCVHTVDPSVGTPGSSNRGCRAVATKP